MAMWWGVVIFFNLFVVKLCMYFPPTSIKPLVNLYHKTYVTQILYFLVKFHNLF